MGVGKLVAGVPIIVKTILAEDNTSNEKVGRSFMPRIHHTLIRLTRTQKAQPPQTITNIELSPSSTVPSLPGPSTRTTQTNSAEPTVRLSLCQRFESSLVPAFFMGSAMVARGEIGLLIAQIAKNGSEHESNGEGLLNDEAFLVCIWAILLCTLVGPISVGFVIRWWGLRVSSGIWR